MKKLALVAALSFSVVSVAVPASAADITGFEPSGVLDVAVFGPSTVWDTLATNNSSPVTANGNDWYYWANGSGSFAAVPQGDSAVLDECGDFQNNLGICWHMNTNGGSLHFNWGFIYNSISGIDAADGKYRAIYTTDAADYYPSGVQTNVSVDSMSEWRLCWLDDWDENLTSLDDIKAACNGNYIALAAGSELSVVEPPAAADNLANTGFNAVSVAAIGLLAMVAGTAIVRRRRTN